MDYYINAIRDIISQMGWVAVALAVVLVIALVVMFGKNVRWKR